MIVACPACQTQYRLDASRLKEGRGRLRCARCKTIFPVATEGQAERRPGKTTGPGRLDVALVAAEASALRQRLHGLLSGLGLRVVVADDGPNALEIARRARPRLVAVTHWLPGLSGPELLESLRDEPSLAGANTLVLGGPTLHLRWPASAAAIHGADASCPEDAREAELEPVLRALLGLPGGAVPTPDEPDVRLHARVAIGDLRLYRAPELDEGRRTGRLHPRVSNALAAARLACLDRFPSLRLAPEGLSAWDDEVRRALRRT